MKCPKCGTTVKDDAKFCFACGAKLEQPKALAEPETIEVQHVKMKPEAPKAKKKGNNKKVGKIVVAVGVCAAVVVVGVNIVPRLTQTDNPCVYLSDGSYNLLTKMKKDSGVDFADGVSTAVFENSPYTIKGRTQFSPSGKYLYFYNNYDGNGGTLCRIRWDKIKKNSSGSRDYENIETIGSNISDTYNIYRLISDDEVIYKDTSDSLYYYNGEETTKIAKQAADFWVDENGRIVYTRKDDESGEVCTLFGVTTKEPDNKIKLASNIAWVVCADDLDNIFVRTNSGEDNMGVGVAGFDRDFQVLSKNSEVLSYKDDCIYYTDDSGDSLSLYDYVEGTDVIDTLKEPVEEDYQITQDKYEMLDEYSTLEDYEAIYTSCTKESMFTPDGENLEDQPEAEFQAFVKKYKNLENEDGYIQVTDEIKDELKNLAALYGEGYENEWQELCFGKKTETVTDEDAYNEAWDRYYKLYSAEDLCAQLKDENNAFPLKILYCYKNGETNVISKDVLQAYSLSNSIIYNTKDMVQEKVKLEDINDISDVRELFWIDYGKQNYFIRLSDDKQLQMSTEGAKYCKDQMDTDWGSISFAGNSVYINVENEKTGIASIKGDTIGAFDTIAEKSTTLSATETECYYVTTENPDDYYVDLYSDKDGKSTLLAQDITLQSVSVYEDGQILASTSPYNNNGYELSTLGKKGNMSYLADDVSAYLRLDEKNLLYISDGDLYLYDGEDTELLAYDVDCMWSRKSMNTKFTY